MCARGSRAPRSAMPESTRHTTRPRPRIRTLWTWEDCPPATDRAATAAVLPLPYTAPPRHIDGGSRVDVSPLDLSACSRPLTFAVRQLGVEFVINVSMTVVHGF